jgi:hypothetical protein
VKCSAMWPVLLELIFKKIFMIFILFCWIKYHSRFWRCCCCCLLDIDFCPHQQHQLMFAQKLLSTSNIHFSTTF